MDNFQFDDLIRSLTGSRRSLIGGALALTAGWRGIAGADAKKKRKRKKKGKKAKPNAFGCLEVGDPCQSEDQCCSGICEGKKGKRSCRAHDTEACEQDADGYCEAGNPYLTLCDGGTATCFRTTAGSNVCSRNLLCADCRRDAECVALGYPLGTACAPIGGEYTCANVCEGGMACVIPVGLAPEP